MKTQFRFIIIVVVLQLAYNSFLTAQVAPAPEIQWQNTIGGSDQDFLYSVIQTADGGYLLGGQSFSGISGDKNEASQGFGDYYVVKLDSSGNIQWQNTIGSNVNDIMKSVIQTADGGYLLGGYSSSGISGDKTEATQGGEDYWVVKLDSSGNIQWQNTIGGNGSDYLNSVIQTADSGYLLGGWSNSGISGDKTEASQVEGCFCIDWWVVKLDGSGNIQWQNDIGGQDDDYLNSVIQTADRGYLLGGYSNSRISGDKTEASQGAEDYWVVKLDGSGNIQWQNTIGGNGSDFLNSVIQTADRGYLLGGYSSSGISGDKTEASQGAEDYWVVKLNGSGNIQWQNTIGGSISDNLYSVIQTADSGYLLGGYSNSGISGDKTEAGQGYSDYWVVKLDGSGNIQWQNTIGGSYSDNLYSVIQTTGGGYLLGGYSGSGISGDKTEAIQGGNDYWVVKLFGETCSLSATITPSGTVSVCSGTLVTLTANSGAGISYQWKKGISNIIGATNSTYPTKKAGNYKVVESNSVGCRDTSAATKLNVIPLPSASINAPNGTDLCPTGSVLLQANIGTGLTYQWFKGVNMIGATNQTYTATKVATYKVKVTDINGCSKTSAGTKVTKSCKKGEAMEEFIDPKISLYPNPTDGNFTIDLQLNDVIADAIIQMINPVGRIVYKQKAKVTNGRLVTSVDMDDQTVNGMYLVQVIVNNEIYSRKVVVQK